MQSIHTQIPWKGRCKFAHFTRNRTIYYIITFAIHLHTNIIIISIHININPFEFACARACAYNIILYTVLVIKRFPTGTQWTTAEALLK